ncbi:uncharacterized protein PAC_13801 [Phialocephala subalpina]|uniref:Alcohol dehydrogenase-like C-terminal domain-containing protein n=1 Tax=Phialocephala subalpina TaxID=576137 RepID=A0A1L7XFW0_9HELO|nr:uncharacterized protein PAC_13801 [Phialocephala subalpina]
MKFLRRNIALLDGALVVEVVEGVGNASQSRHDQLLDNSQTRCPVSSQSFLGSITGKVIPEDVDAKAMVLLNDIFSSGFEVGVLRCKVQPGCTVAVIGVGPIGLAAIVTVQLHSVSVIIAIDKNPMRLDIAKSLCADFVNAETEHTEAVVRSVTGGKGCDTVIEAVGLYQLLTQLMNW